MWEKLWDELQHHNGFENQHQTGEMPDLNETTDFHVHDDKSHFSIDKAFSSREELTDWVQNKGRSLGYVIVIRRSNSGLRGVTNKVFFKCDRGGVYTSDKISSRHTGSRKINCPFRLLGKYSVRRECWTIKVQCEEHNHEPAFHLGAHPYAAQLSANEAQLVADLSVNRVKPRDILTTLKNQNPNNVSTLKTIYNARNKARMTEKAGRTQMQILMSFLVRENYFYQTRVNNLTNELEDLFFAHPISLDIWRAFPHVVLMDATYSTNQYKMPLLEIVGVTSTNMTFCIAFVYVSNENESSYAWALDCLKLTMNGCICPCVIVTDRELSLIKACHNVFPDAKKMLCRWHISENILKRSKKKISGNYSQNSFYRAWNRLVQSLTEEEYSNNLKELQRILEDYQGVLKYVNDTWLNPFKEMFVSVWTDKYLHFGNHTTNRVESQHARFKLYLDTPQSDLQSSLNDVHQMIKAQETHIKASFEKSRTVTKHRYKIPQFKELRGFVSIHALDLIYKELERCDNVGVFSENCGCRLRTSHGLPCAHEQALYYSQSRPIPLDSIDVFWRKLDFTPCIALHDDDISCEEEVQRFTDMFRKQSQPNKVNLLRRLKEIFVPSTISMLEPAVKKTRRGRPSLKDKLSRSFRFISSTQEPPRRSYCDKSEFDGADTLRYQAPARHSSYVSGYQAPTPNVDNNIEFLDQFEPIFHPYIMQVQDVKPDGNCAFRAISVCLGFGEDNWPNIRRELLEELNMYRTEYEVMFNPLVFAEVGASLSWFHEDRFAPFDYWWSMPEMGVLAASRYDRILHVLNDIGSSTFLPLRSTPPHWTKHSPIAIGFVNRNHYVRVKLEGGYPVPTLCSQWLRWRYPCAIGWATPYQARIKRYTDYQESKAKAAEYFDLDD